MECGVLKVRRSGGKRKYEVTKVLKVPKVRRSNERKKYLKCLKFEVYFYCAVQRFEFEAYIKYVSKMDINLKKYLKIKILTKYYMKIISLQLYRNYIYKKIYCILYDFLYNLSS